MIREMLTLNFDNEAVQYYIKFEKERRQFLFQPTLKNKAAPAFSISVENDKLVTKDRIDIRLLKQAKKKVCEILTSKIFDKL